MKEALHPKTKITSRYMALKNHQSKCLAYELICYWPSDKIEKFTAVVAGTQVYLIPDQVDAALFAFKSLFSNSALLSDEVGLGNKSGR